LLKIRGSEVPGGEKQKLFAAKVIPYSVQEENKMLLRRLAVYQGKD
jgi:hypothetical protein